MNTLRVHGHLGTWPRGYKTKVHSQTKQKRNFGCFRTRVRKQPIIALYFEFEAVLKFYNLGALSFNMELQPQGMHKIAILLQ